MVTFGNASGPVAPFSPFILAAKNLTVSRPNSANYVQTKEEFQPVAQELMRLLATGELKISISKMYELKDAGKAHLDLEVCMKGDRTDCRGGGLLASWC
jgi:NADPH:quinone reductase